MILLSLIAGILIGLMMGYAKCNYNHKKCKHSFGDWEFYNIGYIDGLYDAKHSND